MVAYIKRKLIIVFYRELYPKNPTVTEEKHQGKLCVVSTPEALIKPKNTQLPNCKVAPVDQPPPPVSSRRPSVSDLFNLNSNQSSETQPSLSVSSEKDKNDSNPDFRSRKPSDKAFPYEGIR